MKTEKHLILFLLLVATILLAIFVSPIYAALLIPVVAFGSILIGRPVLFLYLYLLMMGVQPLLEANIPIRPVKFINEIFGMVLFAIFLGHMAMRRIDFSLPKKWMAFFGILLGYALIGAVVHRVHPQYAVQCFFKYFSFIPFFILAVNFFQKKDLRVLVLGSIWFFWFNFLLNITWFLGVNPLYNSALEFAGYGSGIIDSSQGTFGSQTVMAYFCAMLFFVLLSLKVSHKSILEKKHNLLLSVTLVGVLGQFYLTYTNHAYIYFCVALVPYVLVTGLWKKKQIIFGVVALTIFMGMAFMFSDQLKEAFSKENIEYRQRTLADGAKVQLFNDLLVDNFKDDIVHWTFGAGPGNGMGPIAKEARSSFAMRMLLPYYQLGLDYGKQQMSSITGNTSSAIFTIWGDFGLVGFSVFLLLYVMVFKRCLLLSRRPDKDNLVPAIAGAMVGLLAFYAMSNVTYDFLNIVSLNCWIWAFLAVLALQEKNEDSNQEVEEPVIDETN